MRLSTLSLAVSGLTSFATAQNPPPFNGSCVPIPNFPDWTPPQLQLVVNNASMAFGFQLAGRALNVSQLQEVCKANVWKWASIGLTAARIQEPACTLLERHPDELPVYDLVLQAILQYQTQILLTQLLHSFRACPLAIGTPPDPGSPFTYLCNNLRVTRLIQFNIGGDFLVKYICAAANMEAPDPWTPASTNATDGEVEAYRKTQSLLFASTLAIKPDTVEGVLDLCDKSVYYTANYTTMHLSLPVIEEYFCSLQTVQYASSTNWVMYSTRAFVQVLLSASDSPGWARWLCENLDERRMHDLYLREHAAKLGFCEGAEAAEAGGVLELE